MNPRYVVSPWSMPFAIHEMDGPAKRKVIEKLRQMSIAPPDSPCLFRPLMQGGRAVIEAGCEVKLSGQRMSWAEAMWLERQILELTEMDAIVAKIAAALDRKTTAFHDEMKLHRQIHQALLAADIPHEQEVTIPEAGRIDFIAWACIAIEVKAKTGGGLSPIRQLLRYLEDGRFEGGILLSTKKVDLPFAEYEATDGRRVAVRKIELWKNAL